MAPIYIARLEEFTFTNVKGELIDYDDDILTNEVTFADDSFYDDVDIISDEIPDDLAIDEDGNIIIPLFHDHADSYTSSPIY